VKSLLVSQLTPKVIREAAENLEEIVLFEDGEPLARILPLGIELKKNANRFLYYPHDATECLYTCWRHPRPGVEASVESEAVPA
jgi:hypothetical protein